MAKEFGSKRSQTFIYLLGFTVAYQALYQYMMWSHLPLPETKPSCWGARDSEAQTSSTAEQCPENELFRNWEALSSNSAMDFDLDEEPMDPMELLVVDPGGHILQRSNSSGEQQEGNSSSGSKAPHQLSLPTNSGTALAVEAAPAVAEASEAVEQRMRSLGSVAHALASSATEREQPLLARIQELQREMCVDPRRREHHSCQDLTAAMSFQYGAASAAATTSVDTITRNGKQQMVAGELVTVKHKLVHWGTNGVDLQSGNASTPTTRSTQSHSSKWIEELKDEQAKMEAYMRELRSRQRMHSLRTRAHSKGTKHIAEREAANLKSQVKALEAGLAEIAQKRSEWESSLGARALDVGLELCAEPQRQGNPACDFFLKHTPASAADNGTASTNLPTNTTNSHKVLRMPGVQVATKSKTFLGRQEDQNPLHTVTANDLKGAHWSGRIPKVACIMAIPMKRQAGAELRLTYEVKHAIENWRAQEYEGPRQLIIVHHYQDKQGAKLASQFADGFYIKAVAARSDVPSTTSLRYGAWASDTDAEVVARWDMNAWHHSQRLAMQVRALGLTGRPACQLKEWTFVGNNGDKTAVSSGSAEGGSLVGQRSWMETHWHPLLTEESREVAAEDTLGFVVQLEAPEMLAYGPGSEAWRRVLW